MGTKCYYGFKTDTLKGIFKHIIYTNILTQRQEEQEKKLLTIKRQIKTL